MKIPNSFSTTIFNRHRIQYESGAYFETDFSKVFVFLPCAVDRVEEINQYLRSVNLSAVDIDISDFGENKISTHQSWIMLTQKGKNLENQF